MLTFSAIAEQKVKLQSGDNFHLFIFSINQVYALTDEQNASTGCFHSGRMSNWLKLS
jgi:hypothetical protein